MTRLPRPSAIAAALLLLAGCYSAPDTHPETVVVKPSFDRSFDAALGAAADVGVQVSSADRAAGRITGAKAGAAVTIDVLRQADGSLRIAFNAPDSTETNPKLSERWTSAYNRRMAR